MERAAGAVIVSTPVYAVFIAILVKNVMVELEGRFSQLWSQIGPILAATAAMTAVVLLFRVVVRAEPAFFQLVLLSVSGAEAHAAALYALGSPVIREGAEVVGWIVGRRRAD